MVVRSVRGQAALAAVLWAGLPACSPSAPNQTSTTLAARAELDLDSGATTINVRATDVGGDLYHVTINPESGQTPKVTRSGDKVGVVLVSTGPASGAGTLEIDLDPHIPWVLRLNGGAHIETVDMRQGQLAELDLLAGATSFQLLLGRPQGTVPVRFTGGATELHLHLPAGVDAQVATGAAIPQVLIDGTRRTVGSAPGTIDVGDASSPDRYAIDVASGVSTLTVDHS